MTPPSTNSVRHPTTGSMRMPSKPANVPPSGTHTIVSVTANGRCRRGTYSAASAAAFGIAPPRPRPARNLRTPSDVMSCTIAAPSVVTPKMIDARQQRRAAAEPIARKAGGRAADHHAHVSQRHDRREGAARHPHSAMIVGMTMPSSWLSMPSNTTVSATSDTSHLE